LKNKHERKIKKVGRFVDDGSGQVAQLGAGGLRSVRGYVCVHIDPSDHEALQKLDQAAGAEEDCWDFVDGANICCELLVVVEV